MRHLELAHPTSVVLINASDLHGCSSEHPRFHGCLPQRAEGRVQPEEERQEGQRTSQASN